MASGEIPKPMSDGKVVAIIGGVVALSIFWTLYSGKSRELEETRRYSRFQSFLEMCDCKKRGVGFDPEGGEEDEYHCSVRGGTVSFSNYVEFVDRSYDPREDNHYGRQSTHLCPGN